MTYSKFNLLTCFVLVFSFVNIQTVLAAEQPVAAPVNPEFRQYVNKTRNIQKSFAEGSGGTGWIPSPIIPEVHSSQKNIVMAASNDPVFDLRDPNLDGDDSDSLLTPVKNQGGCGSCWTFATYGTLESVIKQRAGVEHDFSENHLKHLHGFNLEPCDGGNLEMSAAYFARYHGAINETDDTDDQTSTKLPCTTCSPVEYVENVIFMPVRENIYDFDYIKRALLAHGAVYTSFYWDSSYYDYSNNSYYYTGSSSNHAVVIVGWDNTKETGSAFPGAFIVRNSWGAGWGDEGYFYISYYDKTLGFSSLGYIKDEDSRKPVKIYSHDPHGMTGLVGYNSSEGWGANVFIPDEDGMINAVSFFSAGSDLTYEIYLYDDFNKTPVTFTEQLGTMATGTVGHRGFYTVMLNEEIPVTEGDDFIVVVKFNVPGSNYPIPIERGVSGYVSTTASINESFISGNGSSWMDATQFSPNTNVCIKSLQFKPEMGDIDNDDEITLGDAVLALQLIAGLNKSVPGNSGSDVNDDDKVGMAEVLYVLKLLADI